MHVEATLCTTGDQLNIDSLKAVVACLYYLQFPSEKRSEGRQFVQFFSVCLIKAWIYCCFLIYRCVFFKHGLTSTFNMDWLTLPKVNIDAFSIYFPK